MKFKIGFSAEPEVPAVPAPKKGLPHCDSPRKSLVQVYFPARNMTLSYYNDTFDLHEGDVVFVEGKLEGMPGHVTAVSYSFKIKLSDYKRVIGRADTDVHGTFQAAGSHLVTFDPDVLPYEKVRTWFLPPEMEEDGYVSGQGENGSSIPLEDLNLLEASPAVWDRGRAYYRENKVVCISLEDDRGRAIVLGSKPYELEFRYGKEGGSVSDLVCPCYCAYPCKHQAALLLQMRDIMDHVWKYYTGDHEVSDCLTAVSWDAFFSYVISTRKDASITLD